jgi:hypothetical protein
VALIQSSFGKNYLRPTPNVCCTDRSRLANKGKQWGNNGDASLFLRWGNASPFRSPSRLLDLEFNRQPDFSRQAYQCINAEIFDPPTEQIIEARSNILALKFLPPCGEEEDKVNSFDRWY